MDKFHFICDKCKRSSSSSECVFCSVVSLGKTEVKFNSHLIENSWFCEDCLNFSDNILCSYCFFIFGVEVQCNLTGKQMIELADRFEECEKRFSQNKN